MTDQLLEREQLEVQIARLAEQEARVRAVLMAAREGARRQKDAVSAGPTHEQQYQQLVGRVKEIVHNVVPPGAVVVVVSKGDDALLDYDGREGWHFPQDERGVYAGYYPAESREAIRHLERLRAKGGRYFLLPNTAYWWLDHYAAFGQYLDDGHRRVWADRQCKLYEFAPMQTVHARPRPVDYLASIRGLFARRCSTSHRGGKRAT